MSAEVDRRIALKLMAMSPIALTHPEAVSALASRQHL